MSLKKIQGQNTSLIFSLIVFGVTACAPSDNKVVGEFAKPSAQKVKLESCSKAKLSTSAKTFSRGIQKVCRKDAAGVAFDKSISPSYQAIGKKGRIGIEQNIVFALHFVTSTEKPSSAEDVDAMAIGESAVSGFLAKSCIPKINQIFKNSGLATRFNIAPFRPATDRPVSVGEGAAGPSAVSGSIDDLFSEPASPKVADEAASKTRIERPTTVSGYNVFVEFEMHPDLSISIRDELDPASSGPLTDGTATVRQSQQNFCAQFARRLVEHMGLTKNRDCDSLEKTLSQKAVEKTGNAAEKSSGGIMKGEPVTAEGFSKMKLDESEVDDVLQPLCGSAPGVQPK